MQKPLDSLTACSEFMRRFKPASILLRLGKPCNHAVSFDIIVELHVSV